MVNFKKPVAKLQSKEMRIAQPTTKGKRKQSTTVRGLDFSKYTTESLLKMYFDNPKTAESKEYEDKLISLATNKQRRFAVIAGLKKVWGANLQKAPFRPSYFLTQK